MASAPGFGSDSKGEGSLLGGLSRMFES